MTAGYVNVYECPMGCKAQGGKPIAATIRGWKKHMTKQHGEWTQEQLAVLVGASTPNPEAGRSLFLSEDAAAPEGKPDDGTEAPGTPTDTEAASVKLKTDAASRKVSAKMNKMQKKFADKIPQLLNKALEQKGAEWQLDDSDKELLSESVENCFDVLDVEFAMAPISAKLSNPLWVLLLPLLALAIIFGPKAAANIKPKEEPT